MGADHVIDHSKDLKQQIDDLGYKNGINYIFHVVDLTAEYCERLTPLIAPFGHIVGITGFNEKMNI